MNALDLQAITAQPAELETYRRVFHASPDFISISRLEDGFYIDVNPGFERFTGFRRQEVVGRSALALGLWPDLNDRKRLREALELQNEVHEFETRLCTRNGELRHVELSASTAGIGYDRLLIMVVRDVTERHHTAVELQQYREHLEILVEHRTAELSKANAELVEAHARLEQTHARLLQTERRVRYMALHDVLTGLPNRALLHDRVTLAISQAQRDGKQMALLFIDLDHFKHVNDSLGHLIGDELLRVVAARLKSCVRKSDTVARLGGDEFVVCLPLLESPEQAALLAQKILDCLEAPVDIRAHQFNPGASIGIGIYPNDGTDADMLMQAADASMYHAKAKGRGNYQFYVPSLNAASQQRLETESCLRQALPRNEFVLHYQPQIDIHSGRIVAVEALIRWQTPTRGMVSPLDFIPVAEESGLIVRIGEWVLREACRQLSVWREAGFVDLGIAVNLSARQVIQPELSAVVAGILDEFRLPGSALDIEITESVLMEPSQENIEALNALARMGVRLSVDDFGTGYSSLAYLKRFPIHALKIDRSFVSGIMDDPSDAAIADTIIAMAQSLRLAVTAEGVETAEQAAFLASHHCTLAQGFFYGRPVPAPVLGELLRSQALKPRLT